MSENSNKQIAAQDRQEGPSRNRRLLLKAAASAAPLIATLPSGAALANASASACIIKNKDLSDRKIVGEVYKPQPGDPPSDSFLRFPAWQRTNLCPPGQIFYFVEAGDATGWYDSAGNKQPDNPPPCNPLPPSILAGDTRVAVLMHWIPQENRAGVHPDGFFPVTKLDDGDPGNMGMTASCLCSVDAGYLPEFEQHWCKRG